MHISSLCTKCVIPCIHIVIHLITEYISLIMQLSQCEIMHMCRSVLSHSQPQMDVDTPTFNHVWTTTRLILSFIWCRYVVTHQHVVSYISLVIDDT